jgi:hypothetical protein
VLWVSVSTTVNGNQGHQLQRREKGKGAKGGEGRQVLGAPVPQVNGKCRPLW